VVSNPGSVRPLVFNISVGRGFILRCMVVEGLWGGVDCVKV
jgi:hypothetical protein